MLISLYNLDKTPNPFIKKYVSCRASNSEEVSIECRPRTVGIPQKD